jgi:tetratricopeptide (TPR) repeat protein
VAQCLNSLAGVALEKGDYDEAEKLYAKTYAVKKSCLGKSHPETALTLNGNIKLTRDIYLLQDLASLYVRKEDNERARVLYQKSLQLRLAALGENHPDVGSSYSMFIISFLALSNFLERFFRRLD